MDDDLSSIHTSSPSAARNFTGKSFVNKNYVQIANVLRDCHVTANFIECSSGKAAASNAKYYVEVGTYRGGLERL